MSPNLCRQQTRVRRYNSGPHWVFAVLRIRVCRYFWTPEQKRKCDEYVVSRNEHSRLHIVVFIVSYKIVLCQKLDPDPYAARCQNLN